MLLSLIATLWAWLSYASALSFPLIQRDAPAVVNMELHRSSSASPRLQQRDDSAPVQGSIVVDGVYWLNVSIGTPPQSLSLFVDIQDSYGIDVIVPDLEDVGNEPCSWFSSCSLFGSYNPDKSSTAVYKTIPDETLGWGTVKVNTDTVTIGGTNVKNVPLFYDRTSAWSTIGLSPDNTTFPYLLVDRGLIRSPSFSVWGNITPNGTGGLIFGGVNTAKYHGPLQAFSFKDDTVTIPMSEFRVQTDAYTPSNYTFSSTPFVLSTRYAGTYLPYDAVQQMYKHYNISWLPIEGINAYSGTLECSRQYTENHTISLVFGNATISAPWSEFFAPGLLDGFCYFSIQPSTHENYAQIGNIFVQRMYLALDYDNRFVGVAAMNENPGPDSILEIGIGPKIPDAVGDFPSSIVPYSPRPTVATSTSKARAAMRTMPPTYGSGAFAGVAGVALLAVI